MIILGNGGGTNSSAVLAGWKERGLQAWAPIMANVFADTGNEKPHTYEHLKLISFWCDIHGLPEVEVVKKGGRVETLEENCLRMSMLPSIAYGRKGCSWKYKIEPQAKWANNNALCKAEWAAGRKPIKLIGYDFTEKRRWAKAKLEDDKSIYRFPLVEWEWTRDDCIAALARNGIPQPGKSACFFCPSSKKHEIDALKTQYPDLFSRAIAMEDNAQKHLKTVKGLGRSFSWRDYAVTPFEADAQPCMACHDGE